MRVSRKWDAEHGSSEQGRLLNTMSVQATTANRQLMSPKLIENPRGPGASASLFTNQRAFPRVWIVHDIEVIPPLTRRSREAIDQRTRKVFLENGRARDLRKVAIIEASEVSALVGSLRSPPKPHESCKILHYSPQRVKLEVNLSSSGCVILNDTFYPGWEAFTYADTEKRIPVYQANRVMRAILLPAGQHHIVFRYRPPEVYFGFIVSACSWIVLLASAAAFLQRRRAPNMP